jgi:hypothetical protein
MTIDFKTPAIPQRIKTLSCVGYRNIFEFKLGNQNLFGTETLCGDWDGDLLIVAKDFAPAVFIEKRREQGDSFPYRHEPAFQTNKRLVKLLRDNGRNVSIDGTGNTSCGVLYMSACFFLRLDGRTSGLLPNRKECINKSREVFRFTIDSMRRLKKIACLGDFAFEFVTDYFGRTAKRREPLEARKPISAGHCLIYAHSHTGSRGWRNRLPNATDEERIRGAIEQDWRSMLSGC